MIYNSQDRLPQGRRNSRRKQPITHSRGGHVKLNTQRPGRVYPPRFAMKLLVPALLLLLPMLAVGGSGLFNAQASPPMPGTSNTTAPNRPEELVLLVHFNSIAERDMLAAELNPEEVPTKNGYLTLIADRATYDELTARGLRVEVDQDQTTRLNRAVSQWDDND